MRGEVELCVNGSFVQDPSERSDCGGGRDQLGGSHTKLRCLRAQEHLRNCQVRDALNHLPSASNNHMLH